MSQRNTARELHGGWAFAKVGGPAEDALADGEWLPAQSFPTTVHVELLAHKRIPDPVRPLVSTQAPSVCACVSALLTRPAGGGSSSGCMSGTSSVRVFLFVDG